MRYKLTGALLLVAIAATSALIPVAGAIAQDQQSDEKQSPNKAEVRKDLLEQRAKRAAAAAEPLVGPLPPARARNAAQHAGAHGARQQPPVPEPTVKLKPGEVPAIVFDTPEYDFGRVRGGTEVRHDFWFTNTGTGPLEIVQAKPS